MNIKHDELTWPTGLQQEVQKYHQAKSRAVQEGEGGKLRPLQTRAIMLGRLEKLHEKKYMTPSSAHRDGGPFDISLECLAAQGIHLEMCVRGQPTRARVHACLCVRARLRHVLCMHILARIRARACVACACTDKCMYNIHEHITTARVVS